MTNTKEYKYWTPLERAQSVAQKTANRYETPMCILNMNAAGVPVYVVRDYEGNSPNQIGDVFTPEANENKRK